MKLPATLACVTVLVTATLTATISPAVASPGDTFRVSVDSSGIQGDSHSVFDSDPAISDDGQVVVFESHATNLVPGDTNGVRDIFAHDRATGVTERVNVSTLGAQTACNSGEPDVSGDGRYVAFFSCANNLVPGDSNGSGDVFIHDRTTGVTEFASLGNGGAQGNNGASTPSLSEDGNLVVFLSDSTNLVAGDTNGWSDVFVRDRQAGTTERINLSSAGAQAADGFTGYRASISSNGRYVAFSSNATNLVAGDTNNRTDIFVRDRQTATTDRVSLTNGGGQGNDDSAFRPSISDDGQRIGFESAASNLVAGDTNGQIDVFVRDQQASTTVRVSVNSSGTQATGGGAYVSLSGDGDLVSFSSGSPDLVPGDTNLSGDVYVHSLATGETRGVHVDSAGNQANDSSASTPGLSRDGAFVVFASYASNLVSGDSNGVGDVFVHELAPFAAGDTTPPTVEVTTPPDGATFLLNAAVAAEYLCVDEAGGSGLASCEGTVPDGAGLDTTTLGDHQFTVVGTDNAENATTVTHDYSVRYGFATFTSPIDPAPAANAAQAGRTIPVKWRITDTNGVGVSDPDSFVSVTSSLSDCAGTSGVDTVETYVGGSGLQYLGDGNWQFNWKVPKSYAGQCRTMRLNLADTPGATTAELDGMDRTAEFRFK